MQTITELFNNIRAVGTPSNTSGSLSFTAAGQPSGFGIDVQPISGGGNFEPVSIFSAPQTAPLEQSNPLPSISSIVGPELSLNNNVGLASPFRNTANVRVIR